MHWTGSGSCRLQERPLSPIATCFRCDSRRNSVRFNGMSARHRSTFVSHPLIALGLPPLRLRRTSVLSVVDRISGLWAPGRASWDVLSRWLSSPSLFPTGTPSHLFYALVPQSARRRRYSAVANASNNFGAVHKSGVSYCLFQGHALILLFTGHQLCWTLCAPLSCYTLENSKKRQVAILQH
jgi:hypothetical protein